MIRDQIIARARALGFDPVGIATVAAFPHLAEFAAWIAAGRAGTMNYLARRTDSGAYLREDVRHAWPWARSIICCGAVYNTAHPRSTEVSGSGKGWIARYAWGDDYHEVLQRRLRELAASLPQGEHKLTVDTAPLVEREAALHAGLGWQGKNTCLIHPRAGSYFFLACVVTSLEIAPDVQIEDRCGSCTRCLDACPTQALTPYQMDASRCVSYLNIELRGGIPEELRAPMGANLVGCDICQDVCPWNGAVGTQRKAPVTIEPSFQPRPGTVAPDLAELAALDVEAYRERFRHSAVKRLKYEGLMRNVAVALGNSGDPAMAAPLQKLAASDDPVIREHAEWALRKLGSSDHRGDGSDKVRASKIPALK